MRWQKSKSERATLNLRSCLAVYGNQLENSWPTCNRFYIMAVHWSRNKRKNRGAWSQSVWSKNTISIVRKINCKEKPRLSRQSKKMFHNRLIRSLVVMMTVLIKTTQNSLNVNLEHKFSLGSKNGKTRTRKLKRRSCSANSGSYRTSCWQRKGKKQSFRRLERARTRKMFKTLFTMQVLTEASWVCNRQSKRPRLVTDNASLSWFSPWEVIVNVHRSPRRLMPWETIGDPEI